MSQRTSSRRNRLVLILGGIGAVCGACVFLSLIAAVVSPPRAATPTPPAVRTATLAALPTTTNVVLPPTATVAPAPPTDTAAPPPPTDTAVPPTEPPPPPTDTAVPPTAAPAVQYTASARVDNPTPRQNSNVRVTGKLLKDGVPVQGAIMNTTWHYKSKDTPCNGAKTNAQGEAGCSNGIGTATAGYEVTIAVRFVDEAGNLLATASTAFTPKDTPAAAAPTKAAPAKAPASAQRYDPSSPDRDCPDFRTHAEAQAFFLAAGGPGRDPHRLDADHDGVACETLP
jgi:hypothetical protein